MPAYLQVTAQLCQRHLKAQDTENAWHAFEEYTSAGGDKLPVTTWLEICRALETQQNFERAAPEYERRVLLKREAINPRSCRRGPSVPEEVQPPW